MGNSKEKKRGKKKKTYNWKEKIKERDEHMKGGPLNCVICLVPLNRPPIPSPSSSSIPASEGNTASMLNQVQSIQLCEMLGVPLSFKEGFQEHPLCTGCYQMIEMACIFFVQVPELPNQSDGSKRQKELEDLETIVSGLKASLRRFQIKEVSQAKKDGAPLLRFRSKVFKEIQAASSRIKSQSLVSGSDRTAKSGIHLNSAGENPLETSGPPNCLICMRGVSDNLDVQPLLQEETTNLINLLKLSDKLKQDFKGSRQYACNQCLIKFKSVTEMYKHIERIRIGLGEAKEFFEKGLLDLPTPNAKAASQINPNLVGYVILRRRMAKEVQVSKCRQPYDRPPTVDIEMESDLETTREDEAGSTTNSDNMHNLCEVILTESDDPDQSKDDDEAHESSKDFKGKRFYKDLKCDFCDMTYKCQKSLRLHLNRIHFDILPFPCKFCDQGFTTKERLEKHENLVHLGFKNNECRICRKVFSRRGAMKVHEAKHSGIRAYQCSMCDKNYLAFAALRKHFQAIHGNEKFICELCGKELPSKLYLNSHVKQHLDKEKGITRKVIKYKVPIGRKCTPVVLNFDPASALLNSSTSANTTSNGTATSTSNDNDSQQLGSEGQQHSSFQNEQEHNLEGGVT